LAKLVDNKEVKFFLSNISPFNKLKSRDIDDFLSLCELKEYKSREIIYRQGSPPDYFNLLVRGRVVALTEHAGQELEIELLKRGTCFGIISLFTDETHSVTTKSIENSYILRVSVEKFKAFLNKYPLISLDFSRMLSQRVKSRFRPKKIFQSKKIAVLGEHLSDKTTYMYNLSLQLKSQTNKEVICIEFSLRNNFSLNLLLNKKTKVLKLSEFNEHKLEKFITKDKIDCLLVEIDNRNLLDALLNFLAESYHFIVYELAFFNFDLFYFISAAHYIHLLVFNKPQDLQKWQLLIKKLKSEESFNEEKIKIIINNLSGDLTIVRKNKIFEFPIYATLPLASSDNYLKTVKRIARELGEVVIGLALGSGAAYGFAHIGVLKVLDESSIPLDIVCGSSMGAVIAALWAAGFKIEEIEKQMINLGKTFSLFSIPGLAFPFKGILRARRLENIFKKIFKDLTFRDLKHNLKIVAFDFLRRETVILNEGSLYRAVAASCAMPGVFEPIKFKKDIFLDGGILKPLPTKVLLNFGAHKIIGVDITPTKEEIQQEYKRRHKLHIFDFIFGSIETMQREFIEQAIKISDVIIHPTFEGIGWMEFNKVKEFIKRGEIAAREKIDEITKLVSL
jgi:NTE family protein